MPNKRVILSSLSRSILLALSRFFQIPGLSNKPKDDIIDALMAKRLVSVEEILGQLSRDDLKGICEALGLDSSGKEKNVLIERISGDKMEHQAGKEKKEGRNSGTEYSFAKQANSTEKDAKAYVHEESKVSLRPEIGTQAQFRKKKPPKTYKYDSSLSPELEYDGQNPAREQGEEQIAVILKSVAPANEVKFSDASLPPNTVLLPKSAVEDVCAAANKLKAMSKPFLNWAGKAERLSFDVPTLPLFVHERLSTKAIVETLKSHKKKEKKDSEAISFLDDLFGDPHHSITDQVLKAYEYQDKWTNRMVLGDSLVVMNSLLHYENMGGQVQMIFMDPPYGVKFGSNFQPFVRKRDVKNSEDESMTREPEMVKAYRDTWELGLHSYLTYMRDRLLVARDLLKDTGSIFVQISDENVHHVREVMDDVFGAENFCSIIPFAKTTSTATNLLSEEFDYLLWYAKDSEAVKYNQIFLPKVLGTYRSYKYLINPKTLDLLTLTKEMRDGTEPIPSEYKIAQLSFAVSQDPGQSEDRYYKYNGIKYDCGSNRHWKTTNPSGLDRLAQAKRLIGLASQLNYIRYLDDFPATPITNLWSDTGSAGFSNSDPKLYAVQTDAAVIARCLLMTTDPGDLILDPTCGSGTSAFVAEQWGRRWITADVSRVPLALARQRLLTATFPYFELKEEKRGPIGGFVYKRKQNKKGEEVGGIVPHIMLESIANNNPPKEEVLVDRPEIDNKIVRITGPFAFEATIPTPVDYEGDGIEDSGANMQERGSFVDRMLEVLRQSPVIQLPGNKSLSLKNIRLPSKTLSLSAEALVPATEIGKPGNISDKPLAIVFGPESGAVSEKLVYEAAKEANAKSYAHLLVIGFAIQPNARDLIEKAEAAIGIPATYVQMTPDLMMGDLLKNMRSSQIFSVCGLPDVKVKKVKDGKYQVELLGLDIFDPSTMEHHPLNGDDVPAWFLDTDYNGLCFHVCQAFFPRTGAWESLKKALKGSYEESVWDHLAGTLSEPFEPGEQKTIAVKVIDDRGNELIVTKPLSESGK